MTGELQLRLYPGSPLVAFYEIDKTTAVEHLIAWRHPLHLDGEDFTRPFGRIAFAMEDRGRHAAVVILASTINASVDKTRGLHRYNCVDMARIARSNDRRDRYCLRSVLRITREYLVQEWAERYPRWSSIAAVTSTSLPGTPGQMYKFDGWEKVRTSTGAKGGGHQRPSAANAIADGARGLWLYRYPV
jgi:hypothetical protein